MYCCYVDALECCQKSCLVECVLAISQKTQIPCEQIEIKSLWIIIFDALRPCFRKNKLKNVFWTIFSILRMHDPCNGIPSTKRKDTKIWSPFVDRKCFYHTIAWHAIIFGDRYILNLEYWNPLPSKQPVTMIWCLLNMHYIQ